MLESGRSCIYYNRLHFHGQESNAQPTLVIAFVPTRSGCSSTWNNRQSTWRKVVIASSTLQYSAFCSSAVDGGRKPGLRVRCPEVSSKSYSSCLNLESDINMRPHYHSSLRPLAQFGSESVGAQILHLACVESTAFCVQTGKVSNRVSVGLIPGCPSASIQIS